MYQVVRFSKFYFCQSPISDTQMYNVQRVLYNIVGALGRWSVETLVMTRW